MRPLPLLVAVAILVILAFRRRTLGRTTGAAGVLAVAVLAGYGLGLYTLPSIDDALTRLAPMLGNWTYPSSPCSRTSRRLPSSGCSSRAS